MDIYQQSLLKHAQYQGKLAVSSKVPLENREDLATYYSPGVAQPCREIAKDPSQAYRYTWKRNSVAVVSDGTAVLGLGNIGGLASLPVMEGKAILFKGFGDVDAVPIVLDTQDPDQIIQTIMMIAPTFGGINLEDIAAPNCFYIEEELKKRLSIPVFHDDQHGTAIVVLAGLINALQVVGKSLDQIKIVVSGAGAAGIACVKLLRSAGARHIVTFDSKGPLHSGRTDLNSYKQDITPLNLNQETGTLTQCLVGADVFIGVSQPDVIDAAAVAGMGSDPIIFALSNPHPEIMPDEARKSGARIIATGRSDFPNQVNNVLVFPGLFKGVLQAGITMIDDELKLFVAHTLAGLVKSPSAEQIIPDALDMTIGSIIAQAIITKYST